VHDVATAGIDTIKLHIDTGVNKRIIKVDRVFCLKKRRLALALCRQTGTKKPGTKNVQCSWDKPPQGQPGSATCCGALIADSCRDSGCIRVRMCSATDAEADAQSTNIFLTDNRAT